MAPWAHGTDVTVLRQTSTVDRYGNTIPDGWVTSGVLRGCGIAPRESSEDNLNRTAVIVGLTVYAPPFDDVSVVAGDRCIVNGRTLEVDGDPAVWVQPMTGWAPGIVIQLREVTG